jgi:hypothetical protein
MSKRISELPLASSITGTEVLPIVQGGVTKKIAINTISGANFGWGRYDDTQYTAGSPYTFTSAPFTVPNNAGNIIDNTDFTFYSSNELRAENIDDVYIITIAFKAQISNGNGYMDLYLESGNGTPYDRVRDTITFPKGANQDHTFAKTFQFYADEFVVANGLSVKMDASHNGHVHDVIYFIQRTLKY